MVQVRGRQQSTNRYSGVHGTELKPSMPSTIKENAAINRFAGTSRPQYVQPQARPPQVVGKSPKVEKEEDTVSSRLLAEGMQHYNDFEFAAALKAFQAALKVQLINPEGEKYLLAHTLSNIGVVYLRQGRLYLAGESLEEALVMKRRLRDDCTDEADQSKIVIADVLNNLGSLAFLRGEYDLSFGFYEASLADLRSRNGPKQEKARALYNIGRLNVLNGKLNAALTVLEEACALERELYGDISLSLADTLDLIGFVQLRMDALDDAMQSFSESLSIFQEVHGTIDLDVGTSLVNVGMVLERRGQLSEALHTFYTARDVFLRLDVDNDHRGLRASLQSIEGLEKLADLSEGLSLEDSDSRFIPVGHDGSGLNSSASDMSNFST